MEEYIAEELINIAIRQGIDSRSDQENSYLEFVEKCKWIIQGQIAALHLLQTVVDPTLGYELSYQNLQKMTYKLKEIISEFELLVSKEAVENFLGMINLEGENDFVGLLRSARTL